MTKSNSNELPISVPPLFLMYVGKPRKLKLEQLGFKEILMGNLLFFFAI